MTHETLEILCARGVIPVVPALASGSALALASALKDGGLPVLEMTLRSANALELLRTLAADRDLLVGAGTVINAQQVDDALDAGARFVVTPGVSAAVLERCRELEMPVIPGVATATEVIAALDHGVDLLKLFPAQASGGAAMVKALAAPFPEVRFVPTGGVSAENAASYLRLAPVEAVGGSWMVTPALSGDFAAVASLAAEAVRIATEARAMTGFQSAPARGAATTSWRSARSCSGSIRARGASAPPGASGSGRAVASTTSRAACAAALACEPPS